MMIHVSGPLLDEYERYLSWHEMAKVLIVCSSRKEPGWNIPVHTEGRTSTMLALTAYFITLDGYEIT
jgi:hypothetical protein